MKPKSLLSTILYGFSMLAMMSSFQQNIEHFERSQKIINVSTYMKKSESIRYSVVSDSSPPHALNLPGSSVHGILQARILEWVAIPFFRGSSQPRDQRIKLRSPALQVDSLLLSHQGHQYTSIKKKLRFSLYREAPIRKKLETWFSC